MPFFRPFFYISYHIFTGKTLISRGVFKVALYVFISFYFVTRDSFITILQHDNIFIYGGQLKRRLLRHNNHSIFAGTVQLSFHLTVFLSWFFIRCFLGSFALRMQGIVVGVQHGLFSVQPHIHVLSGDSFKVCRNAQRYAYAF